MLPINGKVSGPGYSWPDGKRIAVMVTFDFDAEYLRAGRAQSKGRQMGFTDLSRGQYGPHEGLARVLACLKETGVRSTFFIPGKVMEDYPGQVEEIVNAGHEVACHSYSHLLHYEMDKEDALEELEKSEELIKRFTGHRPVGYRGVLDQIDRSTLDLLKERGYLYDSTFKDCDWAYPFEDSDLIELPVEATMDDMTYWFFTFSNPAVRSMYTSREVFDSWSDEFDALSDEGDKLFILKLHPQLIGRGSRIQPLEELIRRMQEKGAWMATCEEVARYVLSKKETYHA